MSRDTPQFVPITAEVIDRDLRLKKPQDAAALRGLRGQWSKRLERTDAISVLRLADALIDYPTFAHRFVAYELVAHHRAARECLTANDVVRLGRGLDSWGSVDAFVFYVAGPAWRTRKIPDRLIQQWARSRDRWLRRAALVSTVPLNNKTQGGSGDAERTLRVCRMLALDRDDMVVKAMSWALRELVKRDPTSVRAFLNEHEEELAPRALREVRNKLKTGLKNPRARNLRRPRENE